MTGSNGANRLTHGSRVMGEVVVDRDAVFDADEFLTFFNALVLTDTVLYLVAADTVMEGDCGGCHDVIDVVEAGHGRIERDRAIVRRDEVEGRSAVVEVDVFGVIVARILDAEAVALTFCVKRDVGRVIVIGVVKNDAVFGHIDDEFGKDGDDLVQVLIDVAVIELDVVDAEAAWGVVPEFRDFIEPSRIVLVTFDDEKLFSSEVCAASVRPDLASDKERGVTMGCFEDRRDERRRRRLAMRSRNDDAVIGIFQKEVVERFSLRQAAETSFVGRHTRFVCFSAHVSHDDDVFIWIEVFELSGIPACKGIDAVSFQDVAHRRVEARIRARDAVSFLTEQNGECAHTGAAYA